MIASLFVLCLLCSTMLGVISLASWSSEDNFYVLDKDLTLVEHNHGLPLE